MQLSAPNHTTSTSRGSIVSFGKHQSESRKPNQTFVTIDPLQDDIIAESSPNDSCYELDVYDSKYKSKQLQMDTSKPTVANSAHRAVHTDSTRVVVENGMICLSQSLDSDMDSRLKTTRKQDNSLAYVSINNTNCAKRLKESVVASLKPKPGTSTTGIESACLGQKLSVSIRKNQIFKRGVQESCWTNVRLCIDLNEDSVSLKSKGNIFMSFSRSNIESFQWGIIKSRFFLSLSARIMINSNYIQFHFEVAENKSSFQLFINSVKKYYFKEFKEMSPTSLQVAACLILGGEVNQSLDSQETLMTQSTALTLTNDMNSQTIRPELSDTGILKRLSNSALPNLFSLSPKPTSTFNSVPTDNNTDSKTAVAQNDWHTSKTVERDEGTELFVYPFEEHFTVSIKDTDHDRLKEGVFLNDSVIEFYLKYLQQQPNSGLDPKHVHIYSTFFYQTLTHSVASSSRLSRDTALDIGYDRVKSWTSKTNIFEKKFLVIPINEAYHWYLAIVYNPGALLCPQKPLPRPTVLHKSGQALSKSRNLYEASNRPPQVLRRSTIESKEIDAHDFFDMTTKSSRKSPRQVSPMKLLTRQEKNQVIVLDEETRHIVPHSLQHTRMKVDNDEDSVVRDTTGKNESRDAVEICLGHDIDNAQSSPSHTMETSTLLSLKKPNSRSVLSAAMLAEYAEPQAAIAEDCLYSDSMHQESHQQKGIASSIPHEVSSDDSDEPVLQTSVILKRKIASPVRPLEVQAEKLDGPLAQCHIIVMNSLGGSHPVTMSSIKRYLILEAKSRHGVDVSRDAIRGINARVPEQPNFCDCGVYVLEYVQRFFENSDRMLDLILSKTHESREETRKWFTIKDIQTKRIDISKIIGSLAEEYGKTDMAIKRKASRAAQQRTSGVKSAMGDGYALGGSESVHLDEDDDVLIVDGPSCTNK
ncbi:hypothetical protein RTP6_005425 [Batrachochytrium dendrobatidis]